MSRLTGSHLPRSSHLKHPASSTRNVLAKHHLAHHHILSDSDGVDGDVESSTTAAADTAATHRISHHYHLYQNSTSSISTLATPARTPASATVEPSSAAVPSTTAALVDTPVAPLSVRPIFEQSTSIHTSPFSRPLNLQDYQTPKFMNHRYQLKRRMSSIPRHGHLKIFRRL